MVSIKIIMNGGIIIKAQYAMDKYIIEDEKEKISLAYGEYRMAQLNHLNHTMQDALDNHKADAVATDVENGWNITFNKTLNKILLKIIKIRYAFIYKLFSILLAITKNSVEIIN